VRPERIPAVAVLAVCLPALAGSTPAQAPAQPLPASTVAATAPPGSSAFAGAAPGARSAKRRRRPGCGTFCKQLGGIGAGNDPLTAPVKILAQTVRSNHSGVVVVLARCTLARDCVGAVLLATSTRELGRADLSIHAGSSKRVSVGLTAASQRALRRHHRLNSAFAAVGLKGNQPISISDPLTITEPR
jgi:hypothetical protein